LQPPFDLKASNTAWPTEREKLLSHSAHVNKLIPHCQEIFIKRFGFFVGRSPSLRARNAFDLSGDPNTAQELLFGSFLRFGGRGEVSIELSVDGRAANIVRVKFK
jgi:hypothetical protein